MKNIYALKISNNFRFILINSYFSCESYDFILICFCITWHWCWFIERGIACIFTLRRTTATTTNRHFFRSVAPECLSLIHGEFLFFTKWRFNFVYVGRTTRKFFVKYWIFYDELFLYFNLYILFYKM